MKLYISLASSWWGGGSNTFAYNINRWSRRHSVRIVRKMSQADGALIIAGNASHEELRAAKVRGVFLIHRLDEHVEPQEDEYRQRKHEHLKILNQFCDITVFQSQFVQENMQPYLNPRQSVIILNGADPGAFKPAATPGDWIGHVTWGTGEKKRLDLLEETIASHPNEKFLLIGNHRESTISWRQYPNVRLAGRTLRFFLPRLYRKMKALYFPSQNDPCPNTAIEAILSGVPVAYHPEGGTREIVRDCGLPIAQFDDLIKQLPEFRRRCAARSDLYFDRTAQAYMQLFSQTKEITHAARA